MAVTKISDIINPEVMGDTIEARIPEMLKFTPYAKVDNSLMGIAGDTKTVPSWNFIGSAEDVAEGEEITPDKLTASTTQFTIKKAMKSVGITQEAINSGLGDPVGQAETQLTKALAVKVDNDVRGVLFESKLGYDGSSANISYNAVVDTVDVFEEEENTPKVLYIHPKMVTKLRKDTNFISCDKYGAGSNVMVSGEIGTIANARIVATKKVPLIKFEKNDSGTITIVKDATGEDATNKHVSTVAPYCFGDIAIGDKVNAVTDNYYYCPMVKLEPASTDTEYSEDELPAVTIFLKKDVQCDAEWLPKKATTDVTVSKYYGVALTNGAKVVLAKYKA